MTKFIRTIAPIAAAAQLCTSSPTPAQNLTKIPYSRNSEIRTQATVTSACEPVGYTFGFFNGVQTTPRQAQIARGQLEALYGSSATNGQTIKYEVFYNYSDGFEDFVETFEQRLSAQDAALQGRYELFFEALRGGGSLISRIAAVVGTFADVISSYGDFVRTRTVSQLLSLLGNPPTIANYADHRTRLDNSILEGRKLLLFAHSQGNLFANAAYTYAAGKVGAASVKLVHVAPASPTLNGGHVLADLDLVINGLRLTGTVPPNTHMIPGYLLRPAGLNGEKDLLGHGLLEIYLNPQLPTAGAVKDLVTTALSTLQAPPVQGQSGFFTATLTWNGSGDVDLHTYEPGGSHVYYSAAQGQTGFLDVDNTTANGPEHYYATCDGSRLQTGNYRIAVNNYAAPAGRVATVQVSSRDGVLLTRQLTLGASRGAGGDNSPTTLATVTVAKNATTGIFTATVQ